MRILQLTDLHVFQEPHVRLKGIPTRECLIDVVDYITRNEEPFDQVIVTGDHTHDEQLETYQTVRDILSPWSDRLWQVPGNHDDRAVMRQVFPDRISESDSDRINFAFTDNIWQIIGLDTHLPGEVSGQIEEQQIAWLIETLQSSSAAMVAFFFHHPPVDVGSQWMDSIGLAGRELLHDVLHSDDRIRLMCCGHVHHEFQAEIASADVYTTPSTGIQFDPSGAIATFAADAPGYRVIELTAGGFTTRVGRLPEVRYIPDSNG